MKRFKRKRTVYTREVHVHGPKFRHGPHATKQRDQIDDGAKKDDSFKERVFVHPRRWYEHGG